MTALAHRTLTRTFAFVFMLFAVPSHASSPVTPEMIVVGVIGAKQWCDDRSPEFKKRSQSAYARWLMTNQDAVLEVQKNADYPRWLDAYKNELTGRYQREVKLSKLEHLMLHLTCNDELIELMGDTPIPDPAFATPRVTWTRFVEAIRKGDHETAVSCLASEARKVYLENLLESGGEELRRVIEGEHGIEFEQVDTTTVKMKSEVKDGSVANATFKLILGNWKITSI